MYSHIGQYIAVLAQTYCVIDTIDCDQFRPDAIDLFEAIQKNHKESFAHNEIICLVVTKDYVDHAPVGTMLRSLQRLLNTIDISNFFVHLITTNPDAEKDYQWVLENVSRDPVAINLHVVPGIYSQISQHDAREFYELNFDGDEAALQQLHPHHRKYLLDSKSFCMKPWTALHVDVDSQVKPCCVYTESLGDCSKKTLKEIYSDRPMQELREAMLSDRKVKACQRCYDRENHFNSRDSQRLESLRDRARLVHRVDHRSGDSESHRVDIVDLSISFSNLCNLSCHMCSPRLSTSWHAPGIYFGIVPQDSKPLLTAGNGNIDMVTQVLDNLDSIQSLIVSGGEPFMHKELYEILHQIQQRGRMDIAVTIVTNLTAKKLGSQSWIDAMRGLPKLTVQASIDAEGPRHEYLRPGADWTKIVDFRRELLRELPDLAFDIAPTATIINALHLPDLHQSWTEQGFITADKWHVSLLAGPGYLSVLTAPPRLRDAIITRYANHLDWLRPRDPKGRAMVTFENIMHGLERGCELFDSTEFWNKINRNDQYYSKKLLDYYPELEVLLGEN